METYRLSSKVVELEKEYVIQTSNDIRINSILSNVFVNGVLAETSKSPHPNEFSAKEVLSLVKHSHEDKKTEIEMMLNAYQSAMAGGMPEIMSKLGAAFFYKGFIAEAQNLLNGAIAIDESNHYAYNILARTEIELERYELAVKYAQKTVEMKPSYPDYRYHLGVAQLFDGNGKDAGKEFEEATKINLYYADAYFGLGLSLLLNALQVDDSELFVNVLSNTRDYLKKAAVIDTDFDNDIYKEGMKALDRSELEVAFNLFKKVFYWNKERRNSQLSGYYMKFVYSQNDLSDSTITNRIDYIKSELEKNPDFADLHSDLSYCYLKRVKNSMQEAVDHYQKALNINPSLDDVDKNLRETTKQLEEFKEFLTKISIKGY